MNNFTDVGSCNIYYQTSGAGKTIVFIPGWAYTTALFEKNLPTIAKKFHVVSYDPRSHGRSEVTDRGNNYLQYGQDLHYLLKNLELTDVVLVAWSLGVTTAYSYFEQFGTNNVKAFISVDETPTIIKQSADDWGEGTQEEIDGLIEHVNSKAYLTFFREYMAEGFEYKPSDKLLDRFTQYAQSLSPEVAAHLLLDASKRDYSKIAKTLATQMPVLQVLRKDWADNATAWITKNQPSAEIAVLGKHLMVYEFADEFNKIVLGFLNKHKP